MKTISCESAVPSRNSLRAGSSSTPCPPSSASVLPGPCSELVLALAALVRQREITTLLTAAPSSRVATAATPAIATEITSLVDVAVLLRYAEGIGEVQRAIAVVQTRGSAHDHSIRSYTIDSSGMHIGEPLTALSHMFSTGAEPREPV